MNDIKLYIGPIEQGKLSWIPTIDSVLATRKAVKSKYLYRTVIIFKKDSQVDYEYPMTSDVIYTSSNTDIETFHSGSDNTIHINSYYDYFDGNYYYSYVIMYSNTIDTWEVVNNDDMYAILYDQTSVDIIPVYTLNEWRITKNVRVLIVSDLVDNVNTLIIPNYMSDVTMSIDNYWNVSNCSNFQLFNMINQVTAQSIETFNGLLYNIDQNILIAVPQSYKTDKYNNIILSPFCTIINNNAFSNGTPDMAYSIDYNMLYGENVIELIQYCLSYTKVNVINFPVLRTINEYALSNMEKLSTITLPETLVSMDINAISECPSVITVIFGVGLGNHLTTDIYLQNLPALDTINLALQFYNLAKIITSKSIYLHQEVYDGLTAAEIKVATDKGWKVEVL